MPDYQFNTNLGPAQQQGTSLGDLINTARGVQAYQQAEQSNPLALQKAQMEIEQAKQLNPLAVQKATAETGTAQLGLNKAHAQLSHEMFGGLRNDPDILNAEKNPQAAVRKIIKFESLIENAGVPKTKIAPVSSYLMDEAIKNPKALTSHLDTLIQAGIGATNQQALQTPGVTTNAAGQLVAVQPISNKVRVVGEGGQGGVPPTPNPTTAQAGLLNAATTTAGADWAQTAQDANTAQGRIAIYQNIKRLTPEAFTGVGGERKKFLSGLAQSIGIPAEELATSSTDELTKNTKLLSLAGGNTDAARSIAELATPNAKMTKDAILRVADQLIGIEKLKEAKATYLAPYLSNPAEYVKKQQEFNKYSDFRLFQEMTPDEVAKLKASMSPAEQQKMSQKIREAKTLGIIQ